MKRNAILLSPISLVLSLAVASEGKPVVSHSAMSGDQLAVYQTFLTSYNNAAFPKNDSNGSESPLNLSKITTVFLAREDCQKGIAFDRAGRFDSVVHEFNSQATLPANIRLVDPDEQRKAIHQADPGRAIGRGEDVKSAVDTGFAAGLLTLSEVAFDKNHRYAAMSFSFVCGGLCGHGSTVVFQKKNGKWMELKRPCSVWFS